MAKLILGAILALSLNMLAANPAAAGPGGDGFRLQRGYDYGVCRKEWRFGYTHWRHNYLYHRHCSRTGLMQSVEKNKSP